MTVMKNYPIKLGDKEKDNNLISYRCFGSSETITLTEEEFINKLQLTISNKKYNI